jgi:hypothetical protein
LGILEGSYLDPGGGEAARHGPNGINNSPARLLTATPPARIVTIGLPVMRRSYDGPGHLHLQGIKSIAGRFTATEGRRRIALARANDAADQRGGGSCP